MFEKCLESCESTGIESLELKDVVTEYILAVLKVSETFPSLINLSCSEMKSQVQNQKVQAMVCQNELLYGSLLKCHIRMYTYMYMYV